ncbi:hypothetical protein AAEX37_01105 [Oligella sp. MSHR50489EDL]
MTNTEELKILKEKTANADFKMTQDAIYKHNERLDEIKITLQRYHQQLSTYVPPVTEPKTAPKPQSFLDKLLSFITNKKQEVAATPTPPVIDKNIEELYQKSEALEAERAIIKDKLTLLNQLLDSLKAVEQLEAKREALLSKDIFKDLTVFHREFKENLFKEKAQLLCPWTTPELNKANEQLFYASLQLTKAFICHSNEIFQNIKRYVAIINNESTGYTQAERNRVIVEGFHSLNLLIPVLSTTFASVQSAFRGFGMGELGTVIIDEAGQATPFSALGLLYRSQRCIIVGDPLQVEPIVTTPATLNRWAYNRLGLQQGQPEFSIAGQTLSHASVNLSIQVMADACNPYYGMIGNTKVGCPLVVHRRCLSPIFDISNKISYANRMINKALPKEKEFALLKNEWIDIKGAKSGEKNHFVRSQGEKVVEMIEDAKSRLSAINENVFDEGKLYVISPFKSVVSGLQQMIKKHFKNNETTQWCFNAIGTVHTFQGKEADCVILVLGSDKNSDGAARWAASQANILNVAVTRAKYRLVIIGDSELWGTKPYFNVAYKVLSDEKHFEPKE